MIFYYTLHHTCITLVVNKNELHPKKKGKLHKFYICKETSY